MESALKQTDSTLPGSVSADYITAPCSQCSGEYVIEKHMAQQAAASAYWSLCNPCRNKWQLENHSLPGWESLIGELHTKLADIDPDYRISTLKSKWGGLRFYVDAMTKEGYELIQEAEQESYTICEKCGQPGGLRTGGFWVITLCDEHARQGKYSETTISPNELGLKSFRFNPETSSTPSLNEVRRNDVKPIED